MRGFHPTEFDRALLRVARNLPSGDPTLLSGNDGMRLALNCYNLVQTIRIADVLSQVGRWTGLPAYFGHVSTGLPSGDERTSMIRENSSIYAPMVPETVKCLGRLA